MAKAQGKPLPSILPHPDDIILNYEDGTVDIVGPVSWDVHNAMKQIAKARDGIIDAVQNITENPDNPDDLKRIAIESGQRQVAEFNKLLPPRLRRDIPD